MKLAKVNWPIESENDRIRRTMAAKGMGIVTDSGQLVIYTLESGFRGTCRPRDGAAARAAIDRKLPLFPLNPP
jgi:hypothetical protein